MEAAEPPLSSAEAGVVVDMSPVVLVTDAAAVVVLEEKVGPATVGRLEVGSLGLESCSLVVAAAAAGLQLVVVVPEVVEVVPKVVVVVVGIVVVVVLETEAVVGAETAVAWALEVAS